MGQPDGDFAQRTQVGGTRQLGRGDIDAFERASVRAIGARADGGTVQGTLSERLPPGQQTDIRRSRIAGTSQWDASVASKFDDLIFKFQNKLIDLKRVTQG